MLTGSLDLALPRFRLFLRLGTFFSFEGRTRRFPFAMAGLAILVVWQLPGPIVTTLLIYRVPAYGAAYTAILVLLACLAWPLACLAARRLHDAGLSGWPGAVYLVHLALVLTTVFSNAFRQFFVPARLHDSVSWLLVLTTAVLAVLPGGRKQIWRRSAPKRSKGGRLLLTDRVRRIVGGASREAPSNGTHDLPGLFR